jgi:hypothetical protein
MMTDIIEDQVNLLCADSPSLIIYNTNFFGKFFHDTINYTIIYYIFMEILIPIIGPLFTPIFVYDFLISDEPLIVTDRITMPLIFYVICSAICGFLTYSIDMKRKCTGFYFDRVIHKVIIYVMILTILFLFINYLKWPIMYWLNLFPKQWELLIIGVFLAISSYISYYTVKILTSNC